MTYLGIDISVWAAFAWLAVGVFTLGTWHEVKPLRTDDDWMVAILTAFFWPFIVAIAVAYQLGRILSWIPRGPARLVIWLLRRRTNLPEARIV